MFSLFTNSFHQLIFCKTEELRTQRQFQSELRPTRARSKAPGVYLNCLLREKLSLLREDS